MKKNKSIVSRLLTNVYIRNLLLMVAVFITLVLVILFGLKFYTKHNESVNVPPIKGLQIEEAVNILKASGLKYEVVDSLFTTEGVPGAIIEQTPLEESKVKRGRTIFLIIQAKSVQMVAIPELKDYSTRQAIAMLNSLGFSKVVVSEVPSQYRGIVISAEYKGKTLTSGQKVPKGDPIRLTVGAGGESYSSDSIDQPIQNAEKPFFE